MKKTCGYVDNRGKFWNSIFKANNANIEYEIYEIQNEMSRLIDETARTMRNNFTTINSKLKDNVDTIVRRMYEVILCYDCDKLVEFKEKKDAMEEEIARLEGIQNLPRYLRSDWYMQREVKFKNFYKNDK
jgi:hypothetical protein